MSVATPIEALNEDHSRLEVSKLEHSLPGKTPTKHRLNNLGLCMGFDQLEDLESFLTSEVALELQRRKELCLMSSLGLESGDMPQS